MVRDCLLVAAVMVVSIARSGVFEGGFADPPASAKPQTWYHLVNGNVTKEGVTRDFEALAEAGVGGVQMFDAGWGLPEGSLKFNSPEWFDLVRHAAAEAKRLGLELCLPNCSGWSSSGGPWNPASNAMKRLVFSETRIKSGERFRGRLPRTEDDHGFYRDVAVLAFPVPKANVEPIEGLEFTVPVEVSGFSCRFEFPLIWQAFARLDTEITRDGVDWEKYDTREIVLSTSGRGSRDFRYFAFPRKERMRGFRVNATFTCRSTKDPFPAARLAAVRLERGLKLQGLAAKTFEFRTEIEPPVRAADADQVVERKDILDLTGRMGADGSLDWTAPTGFGTWTVLRFGFCANGAVNRPASRFGEGPEVDKLSSAAVEYHFEQYMGRLCRHLGMGLYGGASGLNGCLVDSYEVGSQNWTDEMEREFVRRNGYSLRERLPIFAGYLVDGSDESEKTLADFRRTVADLFAENYAGTLARKCQEYGLKLSLEPYGSGPFDNLQYGRYADIPMGEFWSRSKKPGFCGQAGNARFAAYVGHVWGRKVIATESFTANPSDSGCWLTTPALIKSIGDAAYADGVNRIIYHRFVHQPYDDRYRPGFTLGYWGMHFDRHQTWWKYAKEFTRYQARCQWMLQSGSPRSDVLFWCGAEAPNQGGNTDGTTDGEYSLPFGWNWDVCETEALKALRVENGKVVTPGGVAYSMLVLPTNGTASVVASASVVRLVGSGAKVVGRDRPISAALAEHSVEPDVVSLNGPRPKWCHRGNDEGEWYFICRNNDEPEALCLSFRQTGKRPELWDPEKGVVGLVPRLWRDDGRRTTVTIDLDVCGSVFVVFRKHPAGIGSERRAEQPVSVASSVSACGPWRVTFPVDWYTGGTNVKTVVMDELKDWTAIADPDLRYFSGTAVYEGVVSALVPERGKRVYLDLGTVKEFAEVTVNGRSYPPLWKRPYRLDITDAVPQSASPATARLQLVVKVTNLWPNRLIGDDAFAADVEWGEEDSVGSPVKRIPEWVRDGKPSPTGRHTFTTWRFWKADDPLLESGLLGPVRVGGKRQSEECK